MTGEAARQGTWFSLRSIRAMRLAPLSFPRAAAGGVLNVEDHDLIAVDRVEDGISESTNVLATHAALFRFLRRIRMIEQLRDRAVYTVGKFYDNRGSVLA
jgi:hypothetical protein